MANPNKIITKYSLMSRCLHWLMSFLLLIMFATGFLFDEVSPQLKHQLLTIHANSGVLLFVLTFIRIAILVNSQNPPSLSALSKIHLLGVRAIHTLLYLFTAVVPMSGYLILQAQGREVEFVKVPLHYQFVEKGRELIETFEDAHQTLAYILLAFIGLHVAGVLVQEYVKKNKVLSRMWFR